MLIHLKTKNQKQAKAWNILLSNKIVFELLYGGAKGGGKTYTGCGWQIIMCLMYPGVRYFVARKELNDLVKFTLPVYREFMEHQNLKFHLYCTYNGQENCIKFYNGSTIHFLACKYLPSDPMFERFGSMNFTGGWAEEAGEIDKNAIINLRIAIGRWKNKEYGIKKKYLITANPKKNFLKTDFVDLKKQGRLPESKEYIFADVYSNTYVGEDYIENLESLTGIDRQRLLVGNWDYDDDNSALVNYDSIQSFFTNSFIKPTNKRGLICDVAGYGSDRFVILVVDGCKAIDIDINNKDPQESLLMVKRFIKKYQVPEHRIVYDSDGVGQLFKTHFPGSIGIVNNSTKYAKNYQNKKTRLAYELAEMINNNELWFDIPNFKHKQELIQEIECLKRKDMDSDGKLKIITKDEMKQLIGRSPDLLDVLIYWIFIINNLK